LVHRYNKDKNLTPNLHNGGKKARIDIDAFKKYVEDNPNKMGIEFAEHFNLSRSGAYLYLKKINFSLKKKSFDTRSKIKMRLMNT